MDREIRYCTTDDGVSIAYCVEGEGTPTILALPAFNETFREFMRGEKVTRTCIGGTPHRAGVNVEIDCVAFLG